ncbi:MAG: TonB-dependent receptor [Flavobacteriales bacterium]|jgi:hypothetical protein|nr:TonB-dependent receptor [Flavobacteriales bacterium]
MNSLTLFLKQLVALTLVSIIFSGFTALAQETGTIRGFVYDKANGEPVMFTNVKIKGTGIGSPTDVNGFYQISNAPVGAVVLEITNVQYSTKEIPLTVTKGKIISKNIYLEENDKLLDEVEVSAEGQESKKQVKMSMIKATKKEIQAVPSIGGEADIATYFQTVPGVVSTGDQGGQMYVRGGSPVQNKVLLDGMVIYNPFHSIGFFSVFDTEIIRNADIYTGGFSAQYGGRISSVMDITTKDGNKSKFSGRAAVNPFGSKLTLEGPIKKLKEDGGGTISYVLSGKTSYLEQTSKLFYSYVDTAGLPFNYTDLYGKVSINGANGSKANIFGYNFSDNVKWKELLDLKWDSYGAGANFVMVPAATPVLIEGRFNISDYKISLSERDPYTNLVDTSKGRHSGVNNFTLGFDFKYFKKDDEIKYGIEINGFRTDFNFKNSVGRTIEQVDNTTELSGYLDYKIVRNRFVLNPGFRLQYYASLGNVSPEPRLGLKFNANEKLRLKFASGIYSQNLISATSDRDVVNLFYGFLSGPDNLQEELIQEDGTEREITHKLQKATHAILGAEYDVAKHWSINVEGYYKWFTQLSNMNRNKIYEDGVNDYPDVLKKDFIIETGDAYGVDFVLKYSDDRLYLWSVYSLGKVTRWDGTQTYSPVFDRRHNINFVGTYLLGKDKKWELNARWNFGSGLPFTQIQGFTQFVDFNGGGINTDYTTTNANNVDIVYGNINEGRLSAYHRLDFAVKRKLELKNKSLIELTASVTNAYSRKNIFYVEPVANQKVYQLPILPSFGFSWSF